MHEKLKDVVESWARGPKDDEGMKMHLNNNTAAGTDEQTAAPEPRRRAAEQGDSADNSAPQALT